MSLILLIGFPLLGLALFTAQVGAEGIRQAIKQTFLDCRGMTRVEHFFPKYKHTP